MPKSPEGYYLFPKGWIKVITFMLSLLLVPTINNSLSIRGWMSTVDGKLDAVDRIESSLTEMRGTMLSRGVADAEFRRLDQNAANLAQRLAAVETVVQQAVRTRGIAVQEASYDQPTRAQKNLERAIKADADMAKRATRAQ